MPLLQGCRKQKETCPANVQLHAGEGSAVPEACSADQSARSAVNLFRLHFSFIRMGSRGTFGICTASSRCTRITGSGGNETTDCAGLARALAPAVVALTALC